MDLTIGETPTHVKRFVQTISALSPTGGMLPVQASVDRIYHLKSLYLLRENIRSLLTARKQDQKDLAEYCGHDKSWMNKFLNEGRGIRVQDFDRIADFFGIASYQLFQPGISTLTERRVGNDRRVGRDRRIGHAGRQLASLRTELAKLPHPTEAAHGGVASARTVPEPVQRILQHAERQIAAIYAELGRQTRATGTEGARVPTGRRKLRRSAPEGPE